MSSVLERMLAQLSTEDRQEFDGLSARLNKAKGDVAQLSDEDIQLIKSMEVKYGQDEVGQDKSGQGGFSQDKFRQDKFRQDKFRQDKLEPWVNNIDTEQAYPSTQIDILDTPFAQHVRQILARDLGEQLLSEEEVVAYVFENKWLPVDCQDDALVDDIYQRFEMDINEVNQWRQELLDVASDKKMAIGLAWFMVIFQLHKRLST